MPDISEQLPPFLASLSGSETRLNGIQLDDLSDFADDSGPGSNDGVDCRVADATAALPSEASGAVSTLASQPTSVMAPVGASDAEDEGVPASVTHKLTPVEEFHERSTLRIGQKPIIPPDERPSVSKKSKPSKDKSGDKPKGKRDKRS